MNISALDKKRRDEVDLIEKNKLLKEKFRNDRVNSIITEIEVNLTRLKRFDDPDFFNSNKYTKNDLNSIKNNYGKELLDSFNSLYKLDFDIFYQTVIVAELLFYISIEIRLPEFSFNEVTNKFFCHINKFLDNFVLYNDKQKLTILGFFKDLRYIIFEEYKSVYINSSEEVSYLRLKSIFNRLTECYNKIADEESKIEDSYYATLYEESVNELANSILASELLDEAKEVGHAIKTAGRKISSIDRKVSNSIDNAIDGSLAKKREKNIRDARESILKGRNKASTIIKKAISLGTLTVINPAIGILVAIVSFVKKGLLKKKQKDVMLNELKQELEILDEKIKDADSDNDRKKKYQYMRLRNQMKKTIAVLRAGGSLKDVNTNLIELDKSENKKKG